MAGEELTPSVLLNVKPAKQSHSFVATPSALSLVSGLNVTTISPRRIGFIIQGASIFMDAEYSAGSAEFVVDSTEEHLFDAELSQEGRTHNARLHSNVEYALVDDRFVHHFGGVEFLAVGVDMSTSVGVLIGIRRLGVSAGRGGPGKAGIGSVGHRLILAGPSEESHESHELCVTSAVSRDVGRVHALRNDGTLVDQDAADWRLVGAKRKASLGDMVNSRERGAGSPGTGCDP